MDKNEAKEYLAYLVGMVVSMYEEEKTISGREFYKKVYLALELAINNLED